MKEGIRGPLAGVGTPQPPPPGPGELPQTPREVEGPYFRLNGPMRSDLLEPGEKPELVLSGRVLNEKGIPIRNAIVYIWSANKAGEYDMVGHKYCGYQLTDEEGRYEFTTIIPGFYNPREGKHLHVKVQGISRPMTTQLYIDGEPGNEIDDYFVPELVIPWVSGPNDVKYGTFDFVIKQVVPGDNVTAESLALVQ